MRPGPFCQAVTLAGAVFLSGAVGAVRAVTLDECIAAALRSNADIRAAAGRVRAAQAAAREARSAYYPMLGGTAAYARTDNPPQAFMMMLNQRNVSMQSDFNNPPETDNLALGLAAKYRLLDFGRRGLDGEMARGGAEVSRLVLRGLQNDLVHQVTRGFYSVLQAGAFVAVQEESVGTLRESLRVARERLNAGGAVKTDVLNLEVQLAQAEEGLIRARNGARLALAALNAAIGSDRIASLDAPVEAAAGTRPPADEDDNAIGNRPELQAAMRAAGIRETELRKAQRQFWPVVNAFGSLDWNGEDAGDLQSSYFVGVAAEWSLFEGFRRTAAMAGAAAQEDAARAEVEKAAHALRLDLTSASIQVADAWERLGVARKSIESAEEALRLARQRYEQGAADLTELLTAQAGLASTRTRDVAARYDYRIALSNLERARGALVSRYAAEE